MNFKKRTLLQLADMICGNTPFGTEGYFVYRSSSYITEFFQDIETNYVHDGSTRNHWVADTLEKILKGPKPLPNVPPTTFSLAIERLMDPSDATNEDEDRANALKQLNIALSREGFEAFYGEDRKCHLKHIASSTIATLMPNPHRPFTAAELGRRSLLEAYLDACSEDDLIEEILLPLFRQLGFHRITPARHKDKALEYGKDIWMKYVLPTQHVLYFGIQAKKNKLDSAGATKGSNANIAEIFNQVLMMLGHEIFDPELSKKVLVDHAFIVAGGEITKAARNWLGGKLDASKRSQIMFMDREDILNLYVVTNLPLPESALPEEKPISLSDIPF